MTYLLDMDGNIVHQWKLAGTPGGYARLLPNGNLLAATTTDDGPPFKGGAKGGLIRELDWDGKTVWEHHDPWQHHDFRRLANGNLIYAAWEPMPEDAAARVKGGIPGSEGPNGMFSDLLREVNPDGEVVWEWHVHDGMDIEKYPNNPLSSRRVFAWMNTCSEVAGGDILISLRQINTVAIVDRKTGRFRWEMRNDLWGLQHDIQELPNGNMMVFANGMHTAAPHAHSFVSEFKRDGEIVWEYRDDPVNYFYSHHISGCERLPSGNTLICEGSFGRIFEVTPDKQIVWEFINPDFSPMFDGQTANWVFRAFRYGEDSPEIAGRLKL
ncbi:MAG: aryl-sulfate sulfotransferase [Hyphomicrobiales bacterium]|nr:aryl-sulfate sulfotransferase [Hyphomicrobiales bacterium]